MYFFQGPSIISCTKNFLHGLQEDFPATIPTVFRTGNKLTSACIDDDLDSNDCILCKNVKDTSQTEASALFATIISQKFSNPIKNEETKITVNGLDNNCSQNTNSDSCCNSCDCQSKTSTSMTKESLDASLCYSCRIIIKELVSLL